MNTPAPPSSMPEPGSPPRLAGAVPGGAGGGPSDAATPAALAVTVAWWQAVEAALAPALGRRGVAALRRRCLHLAALQYPFLALADDPDGEAISAVLERMLRAQTDADVAAAAALLARTLTTVLESLIGPPLTQRLLQGAQLPFIGGSAAQDGPS